MQRLIFIAATIICSFNSTSQLVGRVVQSNYKAYIQSPDGELLSMDAPKSDMASNYWVVYSDRSNNRTYSESSFDSESKKLLDYMQPCVVLDETTEFLRVAMYKAGTIKGGRLVEEVEDFGWVPKKNLLLWNKSLVTKEKRIARKVLATCKLESLKEYFENPGKTMGKYAEADKLHIFNDPVLSEKNDNDVRMFEFLFVYKEVGNSLLIGRQPTFNRDNPKDVFGWVSKNILQEWNQRLVLEPNYDSKAVQERIDKGIPIQLFYQQDAAAHYSSYGEVEDLTQSMGYIDQYARRLVPDILRPPVLCENLSELKNNIVKTGMQTAIFSVVDSSLISREEQAELNKQYEEQRGRASNVNVIFVLDNSKEYKNYQTAIYDGIKKAVDFLFSKEDNSANKDNYQFGAVYYRDYSEENTSDGDKVLNDYRLSNDRNGFLNFLQKESAETYNDITETQAIFHALNKALSMLEGREKQTNIIVVFGGGGNLGVDSNGKSLDPKGYTIEGMTKLFVKYNAALMAYQVFDKDAHAYTLFQSQLSQIVRQSAEQISEKDRHKIKREKSSKKIFNQKSENIFELDYPFASSVAGLMIYPIDRIIDAAILKSFVIDLVAKIDDRNETLLEEMDSHIRSVGPRVEKNEAIFHQLAQIDGVSADLLNKLSYDNIQLFYTGYTAVVCEKLEEPLFTYSLFVTQDELSNIYSSLEKITEIGESDDTRKPIVNGLKDILSFYYGEDESTHFYSMSPGEIIELATGLPSNSDILYKYDLDDIMDVHKVDVDDINEIYERISLSVDKLRTVRRDGAQYSFKKADVTFYWVPQESLP